MNNRIKLLQESRGAKLKEIREYLASAEREKRNVPSDDAKLKQLEAEYDSLSATADAEVRQLAREMQTAKSPYENLSADEQRDLDRFDLGKVCRALMSDRLGQLDGIEAEVLSEGEKEARAARVGGGGIFLPGFYVQRRSLDGSGARELRMADGSLISGRERRDMTATGGTSLNQGGYVIQTDKMGILDALFNALVLREAGATVLTGLQGNFDWPRITSGTAPSHKAENADADEISPTVTGVSFTPKRLPGIVDLSDQLLLQTGNVIEQVVRRNLTEQVSSLAEFYAIEGTGASNQPVGILSTSGIGSVVCGTNGGALDWTDIVNFEARVNIANANRGTLHYLTNYKVKGMLNTTPKVSSTDSRMLLEDSATALLNGYKPLFTNNVASNRTKGSASGVCSSMIFGQFADLVMAFWAGLNIEKVRDVPYAKAGKSALVFNVFHDSNVIRPASFSAAKDVLTTAFN